MPNVKENKIGFIDLYHGKFKHEGNDKAQDLEGQIKINGVKYRCKIWLELQEGITKNEKFTGYIYELVEDK